jgi:hypothetical protein
VIVLHQRCEHGRVDAAHDHPRGEGVPHRVAGDAVEAGICGSRLSGVEEAIRNILAADSLAVPGCGSGTARDLAF